MNETPTQIRSALRRLYATHKLLTRDETARIAETLGISPEEVLA